MRKRGLLFRRSGGNEAVKEGSAGAQSKKRKQKKKRRREEEGAETGSNVKDVKRHVPLPAAANKNANAAAPNPPLAAAKPWGLASPVHKAAASALGSLMAGKGKSLKALTLFPNSNSAASGLSSKKNSTSSSTSSAGARRATHAVASETLRRLEQLTLALKAAGYGSLVEEEEGEEGEREGKTTAANGAPSAPSPSSALPPLAGSKVAQRLPRPAALVLAYDLLFGQGLRPVGPAERALLKAEGALRAAVEEEAEAGSAGKQKAAATATTNPFSSSSCPPSLRDSHPRSARVNALEWTLSEALACFKKEEGKEEKEKIRSVERDPLVEGVLLFPPRTDLHDHPAVLSGKLILQSRASCLPAVALAPQEGWEVVDACAAPGNKTTHLAALVGERGRVLAFDRDATRLETLKRAAERAGAGKIVRAQVADFLKLDPFDPKFASVRAVLLDPSCSGSGTASADVDASIAAAAAALESTTGGTTTKEGEGQRQRQRERERDERERRERRVAKLASFQLSALKHALSFPGALRVAYSTCSVHAEENERVVARALAWLRGEEEGDEGGKKSGSSGGAGSGDADASASASASASPLALPPPKGWRLARALPDWPTRGIPEEGNALTLSAGDAAKVIRAHPATDGTDGFFVAVFER